MSEADDSEGDRQRHSHDSHGDRGADSDRQRHSHDSQSERSADDDQQRRQGDGSKKKPLSPARLARRACDELAELLGREIEGVVSLERTDDGWCVGIEVLEIRRVPDTSDVLAEYEVVTDRRGRLRSYHRVRRYTRASTQVEQ